MKKYLICTKFKHMWFILGILFVVALIVFFKLTARKIDDLKVEKQFGLTSILSHFLSKFGDAGWEFSFIEEKGAILRFQINIDEAPFIIVYNLRYLSEVIFLKFSVIESSVSGSSTRYFSPKYHFRTGIENQSEMFESILAHSASAIKEQVPQAWTGPFQWKVLEVLEPESFKALADLKKGMEEEAIHKRIGKKEIKKKRARGRANDPYFKR